MKELKTTRHALTATLLLGVTCCLTGGLRAGAAQLLTNFFTGSIALDGDISDFFQADGLTPKAGVCVQEDAAGLAEPPASQLATKDGIDHPSGLNQRRLMTAFNPSLNNGTLFIGMDLPGGTGSNSERKDVHAFPGNPNPNYADTAVGAVIPGFGRGPIRPFDADGNGEADTLGRTGAGDAVFRCSPGATLDIFLCAKSGAAGATDNPRSVSGETVGAKENYVATILFGNGAAQVALEFYQDYFTPAGVARLSVNAWTNGVPTTLFGARVSSSTGGDNGSPLGFDVEFALTNINAAVSPCDRLVQQIVCDSGSNRDGASQGEDQVGLTCAYEPPACTAQGVTVCAGSTAILTATNTAGIAPFTVAWRGPGGAVLTNGWVLTIPNAQVSASGTYTFTIADAAGCSNTCTAQLTVNPNPTCTINPASTCAGSPGSLTVAVSGGTGPYVIFWNGPGGFVATNVTTITIPNAQAVNDGVYRADIVDARGCITSCEGRLTVYPNPVVTVSSATNCAGLPSTICATVVNAATVGPVTYLWSPGGQTTPCITNSPQVTTTYTVVVTTAEGCRATNTGTMSVLARGAIGDLVWLDANTNGCQDPATEPGVANVQVELYDCAGTFLTNTVTDAQGLYLFPGLCPGDYRVRFIQPAGYAGFTRRNGCGTPNDPARDSNPDPATELTECVTLSPGETNRTIDAGLTPLACLGDYVWEDLNRDGLQNEANTGIPNVIVQLLPCAGTTVLQTTTTDSRGFYLFCDLVPGSYRVRVLVPGGYTVTLQNQGTNDCADSDADATGLTDCVTVVPGETNLCTDIGLYRPACLGDYVWEDLNRDGLQNEANTGIPNVTVQLLPCAGTTVLQTTTTDSRGFYLFCDLVPGSYRVQVLVPGGYTVTLQNQGLNDCADNDANAAGLTDCVTLASGETNLCTDIGLSRPACLGDYVWEDLNRDGLQNDGDTGLSNVTVQLLPCAGTTVLQTTATDDRGFYLFCNLVPGSYRVRVLVPGGYTVTLRNQGPDDCRDSDADATGLTDCTTLASGETNLCTDIGLFSNPRICVTKEVACLLETNLCGTFGESATGVKVGTNLPAFCYRITVNNCGDLALTNVTVVDDVFGDLTAEFPCAAGVLPPGASCSYTFKVALAFDLTNTVVATGVAVPTGRTVTARDSAEAPVLEAGIVCTKLVSTNGLDYAESITIPQDGLNHAVYYWITVSNASTPGVALTNLQVIDPLLGNCDISSQVPALLPSGGAFSVMCALSLNCNQIPGGQLRNTVTVSGEVFSAGGTVCVQDLDGKPITAQSACSALVTCEGCQLRVFKHCLVPPPPPPPFNCSGAKPITLIMVQWNGAATIYVRAWNGSIGTGTPTYFGPVAPGDVVTFTRSASSTPNDIYFELFTDASLSAASKLGNSTFHLSCSDADMNGPEDCGKPAGDGKGQSGFINQWVFVGMGGNNQLLDCYPTPPTLQATNTVCDIMPAQNLGCGGALGNATKPTSLTFRYSGGGCAASSNPQSGKATCTGQIDPTQPITITTPNGYAISPNSVLPGDEFTVSAGGFNADSTFILSNAGGTETLKIHTSCSQLLAVGDVFGSLTLVGFNGQRVGADVIYVYTVINPAPGAVAGIVLTDDKLGPVAGPFDLPGFGSTNFQVSANLSVTVTNVATAAAGPGCEAESNPVVVRVPEKPPTLPCATEICADFNDKLIAAGHYIWFNAVTKVNKRDGRPGTVAFTGQRIKFTSNGVNYDIPAPDALIIYSPTATMASTVFDTASNRWVTTVPVKYNGNVFIGGMAVPAPAGGFAKKMKPVCWSGGFDSDLGKVEFEWKWAAAVYKQFSTDYNALGVKPIDGDKLNPYKNGDHAGTPENFKKQVVAGARGGGGANVTGSYTGARKITCGTTTPSPECTSAIVAFLVQYTGPDVAGPLTLKFVGSQSPSTLVATYLLPGGLTTGTTLALPMENDPDRPWTIDATKHNQTKLGTKTEVYFNNMLTEVFHTSCSCNQNNFIPGLPACLDASSPDNPTGTKGYPSPLFMVLDFK